MKWPQQKCRIVAMGRRITHCRSRERWDRTSCWAVRDEVGNPIPLETLDLGAMRAAARHLAGTHSFERFYTAKGRAEAAHGAGSKLKGHSTVRSVHSIEIESPMSWSFGVPFERSARLWVTIGSPDIMVRTSSPSTFDYVTTLRPLLLSRMSPHYNILISS